MISQIEINYLKIIKHQTGLRPATLLKKRLWHRCFPLNFAKFLRTPNKTPLGDCFWRDIDLSRTCLETHCCLLCMCSLFANISYHEGLSSVRNKPETRTGKVSSSDTLYLLKYNFKTKNKSEIGDWKTGNWNLTFTNIQYFLDRSYFRWCGMANAKFPAGKHMLKANNRNTGIMYEIFRKLKMKTTERAVVLVPLLLTLNIFYTLFLGFYC